MLDIVLLLALLVQQPPWKSENLQYFPKDITRPQLIQRMREFSFSLGVRCQYCHPGGNGIYSIRASDGAGLTRITSNPVGTDIAGDYSPDGTR